MLHRKYFYLNRIAKHIRCTSCVFRRVREVSLKGHSDYYMGIFVSKFRSSMPNLRRVV